jgi:hypothetical protein
MELTITYTSWYKVIDHKSKYFTTISMSHYLSRGVTNKESEENFKLKHRLIGTSTCSLVENNAQTRLQKVDAEQNGGS